MIARARRRQQLAQNRDVQYLLASPRGRVLLSGLLFSSMFVFICTVMSTVTASEYVVSDLEEKSPTHRASSLQSQHGPRLRLSQRSGSLIGMVK